MIYEKKRRGQREFKKVNRRWSYRNLHQALNFFYLISARACMSRRNDTTWITRAVKLHINNGANVVNYIWQF